MPSTGYLPLRWESTGDQWWFANPIDCAAANGHYELVRELLHVDPNLLIKLTSLPRIRRLESLWDDEEVPTSNSTAKSRAHVAHKLLQECDASKGHNSLIRAGYGGWLLYTAASAGDLIFVRELLDRDPFLVFGEGEYGVTDVLYAASRGKNREVFRLLLELSPSSKEQQNEDVITSEMMNRALHASARGGNVEMLRELLGDNKPDDVMQHYRDARGSSLLHTASGSGRVEVIKYLISSYDVITTSVDDRGNTALHVAAFRGQLTALEVLLSEFSSLASVKNDEGDTFLHMAVAGFRASGFRRKDKQIDLMKHLLSGNLVNLEGIIDLKNKEGRTALHVAAIEDLQCEIVELLVSVSHKSLNELDNDGCTPLDLLKRRPRSAASDILIKRLVSLGGVASNHREEQTKVVSNEAFHVRTVVGSPGTSFRIPDSDIILCTSMGDAFTSSRELTASDIGYSGEINYEKETIAESYSPAKLKRFSSVNKATSYLKILLLHRPIPLRQQYATGSSCPNNKRMVLSLKGYDSPSLSMRKKAANRSLNCPFVLPKSGLGSPSSSAFSESYSSSPVFVNDGDVPRSVSYNSVLRCSGPRR